VDKPRIKAKNGIVPVEQIKVGNLDWYEMERMEMRYARGL
jgi:hypothetical protein